MAVLNNWFSTDTLLNLTFASVLLDKYIWQ